MLPRDYGQFIGSGPRVDGVLKIQAYPQVRSTRWVRRVLALA